MDEEAAIVSVPAETVEQGWLVLSSPPNPTVRIDGSTLERVVVADSDMILEANGVAVVVNVSAGAQRARELAAELVVLRRSSTSGGSPPNHPPPPSIVVGDAPVFVRGDHVVVGDVAFLVSEVEAYAEAGALLPLPHGHMRAAFAMLVIGR